MIAEAERLGAHRVLSKPVDMSDLTVIVQQCQAARIAAG
jgi:hypothetical protein